MKLPPSALTQLARERHFTLQIPHITIRLRPRMVFDSDSSRMHRREVEEVLEHPPEEAAVEYPDHWFCWLKAGLQPCMGREVGFLYFTRAGYEANLEALREASGEDWPRFQKEAEQHFKDQRRNAEKLVKGLEAKLLKARAILDGL